tara:strand:+ start:18422 stop:20302 length:1881 start_codon:yes stop_codon:yes gene_type:complete
MKKTRSKYLIILFLIALCGCTESVNKRSNHLYAKVEFQPANYTYLETEHNELGIDEILKADLNKQFKKLESTQNLNHSNTYWLKVDLSEVNLPKTEPWIIASDNYTVNNLYYQTADNIMVSRMGEFDPIENDLEEINWKYHQFSVTNLIEGRYVYIQLRETFFNKWLVAGPIEVTTRSDFSFYSLVNYVATNNYKFRAVLFIGGIAFLLIYTFGIYFIYKDSIFLHYGIYLVFLLMYLGIKMYPQLSTIIFGHYPVLNHMWNEVTQVLLNFWYTRFVRKFIDAKNLYPKFDKAARYIEWFLLVISVLIIVTLIISPINTVLIKIVTLERLVMIFFAIASNVYIIKNLKDRRGLFILVGSTFLLSGSVAALVLGDIQYFMMGVMIEIFIFAMGLGILMKRREDEKTVLSKEMERVKMTALQTQMNPHFIFNSLNSIRSYMLRNKTNEASGYLSKFSRLIRLILEYSSEEHITLEEELKVLSLYVHIEQLRFREEFGFTIEMSGDINAEQILVPPLIVQPFLENAIWHGLMQKEGEKELVLDVTRKRGLLQITLRDNGIGRKKAGANKSGAQMKRKSMAIELTTKRLEILNSKSDLRNTVIINDLYDSEGEPLGTEVIIKMPEKKRNP